jgi:hypothetical protein
MRARAIGLSLGAMAIVLIACGTAAEACSGCGCRGGPGYRAPNGRCVGWADIGRICGSPPSRNCTPEGPNAGAAEAADHGVKALEAKRPRQR